MSKLITLIALFTALSLTSCITNRTIAIDNSGIVRTSMKAAPYRVSVCILDDMRHLEQDNFMQMKKSGLRGQIKKVCINLNKYYMDESASVQISRIFSDYIVQKGLFFRCFFNDPQADYFLKGELNHFLMVQKISRNAIYQMPTGLIGEVIKMGIDDVTDSNSVYEFRKLRLEDKEGNVVIEFGDIKREYNEPMLYEYGTCECAFKNANINLKVFLEEVALEMEKKLKETSN